MNGDGGKMWEGVFLKTSSYAQVSSFVPSDTAQKAVALIGAKTWTCTYKTDVIFLQFSVDLRYWIHSLHNSSNTV